MIFFVMLLFSDVLTVNGLRKNDNENNLSTENLKNGKSFNTNVGIGILGEDTVMKELLDMESEMAPIRDIDQAGGRPIRNEYEKLKTRTPQNMDSIIREKQNITHNKNANNATLLRDMCSNVDYKNTYATNPSKYTEHVFIQNNVNSNVQANSVMTSNNRIFQEHLCNNHTLSQADQKKVTIPRNISLKNTSKSSVKIFNSVNTTTKNLHVTSDDQLEYIPSEDTECYYDIGYGRSILIHSITLNLDDSQLIIISDLILHKTYLINLSMKNNFIRYIPENLAELYLLKKLDLSYNIIDNIECEMKNMKLEWLDLSYNYLTHSSCEPIFAMTTLKYLNLQNNVIEFIIKFNSVKLISLNISNNPITSISKIFYDLPDIIKLFMSNLKMKKFIYFYRDLSKLKVLDISYNKITSHMYNIGILSSLEEINLSNCELTSCPVFSEIINLKKLILSKNNIQTLPIYFDELKDTIEILDLRNNPLKTLSTKYSFGALDILTCYYGKVLLDESIIQDIQNLTLSAVFSAKYNKEWVYFKKFRKNKIDDEFNMSTICEILGSNDPKIKKKVVKTITLMEEMRDSGFIHFKKVMKYAIKIIKKGSKKQIRIDYALTYLNNQFSSKFYKFLEINLYQYKIESLKLALLHIYNSDEHLNYWMYYLSDILFFAGTEIIKKNSKIHNDKNIVLNSFINIIDPWDLIHVIKFKLKKDERMKEIFYTLLCNMDKKFKLEFRNVALKRRKILKRKYIQYILKKYQIID